jgi:hypothetical protein
MSGTKLRRCQKFLRSERVNQALVRQKKACGD